MPEPIVGDTWTYSGDPTASQRDEVRFLVQDTDEDLPLLLDAEVDYLLAKWMPVRDSTTWVAALAADLIARKLAAMVNVSADGVDVSIEDLTDRFKALATDLRADYEQESSTGEPTDASSAAMLDQDVDPSIRPLNFSIGMHDNPSAGQQDYGGWPPYAWNIEWPVAR